MSIRTVRMDQEVERALQEIMEATGLSASAVLKRGVETLRRQMNVRTVKEPAVAYETRKTEQPLSPYQIYAKLDLGPGGCSRASSADVDRGVQETIREKLGR